MSQSTETIVSHSPAPWHVEPAPSASSMKSIRTEAGKAVAFVNRGPAAEANERLIKAAPDMHALLERCMDTSRAGRPFAVPDYLLESIGAVLREVAGS